MTKIKYFITNTRAGKMLIGEMEVTNDTSNSDIGKAVLSKVPDQWLIDGIETDCEIIGNETSNRSYSK